MKKLASVVDMRGPLDVNVPPTFIGAHPRLCDIDDYIFLGIEDCDYCDWPDETTSESERGTGTESIGQDETAEEGWISYKVTSVVRADYPELKAVLEVAPPIQPAEEELAYFVS